MVSSHCVLNMLLSNLKRPILIQRKCYSTETALLRMVNDLQAPDSDHVYILSLLDLYAAFDTIDHDILIEILHITFGCSGTVLDWFTSYLSCRTQFVFVCHEPAPPALKCCMMQDSVLGPLFFFFFYFVHTVSQHCHLSVRSFVPFLCRRLPASQLEYSSRLPSYCP